MSKPNPRTLAVAQARRHYAEGLRLSGGLRSDAVVEAFASVPRERCLGPGPWQVPWVPHRLGDRWDYRPTEDADPRHLYHNVLVAIDRERELHNGLPSFLAFKIDVAGIKPRDRVVHVGCGVGYYTAIMAELAHDGRVIGIELDRALAERSRVNLAAYANVEVICGDGTTFDPGPADVFFINAGATHPAPIWLERLAEGGRMILLLTHRDGRSTGIVLLVTRSSGLAARAISTVSVFDCAGARDPEANRELGRALERGDASRIRSLRSSDHAPDEDCWVHVGDVCVSTLEPS